MHNKICYKQSNWDDYKCALVYVGFNDGMKLYFVEKIERGAVYVVGIIYESRPDVTADAAALCLKSGNACILRGGSESFRSNNEIAKCLNVGLIESNLPESSINLVGTVDRRAVSLLLSLDNYIDVIIPRGGKSLVGLISAEAKVPVI